MHPRAPAEPAAVGFDMVNGSHVGEGRIGVCSWSLREPGPAELARVVDEELGLRAVQLALDPVLEAMERSRLDPDRVLEALGARGVGVVSGMMAPIGEDYTSPASIRKTGGFAPDETWDENLRRARSLAGLARRLEIGLVTMHAGAFASPDGSLNTTIVERLREVVGVFAAQGVRVAFETGQEDAHANLRVLEALGDGAAGLNFDPANVVLYGTGDPIESLRAVLPHVWQCHIKDATPPPTPGSWGTEVVVGTGVVDWASFFEVLASGGRRVDLVIEREAGDDRVGDAARALAVIEAHCPWCTR